MAGRHLVVVPMSLENTHARRKGNPYANSRSLLFRNISITLDDWRSELQSNGRRHEPPTETSRQLELFITRAYRKDRAELAINMTARWHCDCSIASICRVLRGNLLLVAVVISVVAGIGLGLGLRPLHPEYHVVAWIGIWGDLYSPLGIMSLICSALLEVDDISKAVVSVGFLMVTIVVGCFVHQLVVLPVLMAIICRRNPYTYFLGIFDGYLAGIASLSSVAAMPYLLQSIPDKLGVNRRVTQFTLPVLISVNRDGSALFIIVAVIYIAQTYAVQLGAVHLLMLMILVTVLSVTTSVIPSGSVMVIIMMSNVIQLPVTERLGLLMAVEWFNDRIRTGTNITSHGYGCAIIDSVARRTAQKVHLSLDGSDVPHDNEEVEMMCVVNIQEQEPEKLNNI
ncbi:hypothetical protein LSH36_632g01090 [Paralvinella palmiformis]|uniref:Amino acid transporter n=1 Tax=Paralvinella palmiformis TaxID=53620 RepID=A0AAD9J4P7_9ANNE|nr:hypothetical protein LSH36_632g01090 [Paralvinella palmiformis]